MRLQNRFKRILDAAFDGCGPNQDDCIYLLSLPGDGMEAAMLTAGADTISRKRFGNQAILLGQIGIDIAPCPGNCKFCVFGEGHTTFEKSRLSMEEILSRARDFTRQGDLYALFLMTMHEFDLDYFLQVVERIRREIPAHTQIVVNIGDFDIEQGERLADAGVNGAYHVRRLREGKDTSLEPEEREKTIATIRQAGLDFYYCCEPIGPEHTPAELVEQMFLGIRHGCFQHAAMRRVFVSSAPLSVNGQITERRLAQVVAVITLASLACPETKNIAVHEPNLLGLAAGANVVYAETGANPRDIEDDTSQNRGLDICACRKMLYEAGFTALLRGDGTSIPLDLEYVQRTSEPQQSEVSGGSQMNNTKTAMSK